MSKIEEKIKVNGQELTITNADKVFWPKERFTKGDLIEYYRSVAKYILPYLKDRPESMNRYPDGINGESFFQKNLEEHPGWVKTISIKSDTDKENVHPHTHTSDKKSSRSDNRSMSVGVHYVLCQDEAHLVYLANLACIEINPWNSRVHHLDHPDFMIIDLDPPTLKSSGEAKPAISFDKVIEATQEVHKILDKIGAKNYCKTSGASGLHIYVPLGEKYTYDQVRNFAEIIATYVNSKLPKTTSVVRDPAKRKKKIYLDYLQNSKGQTVAAPYSVRPHPGIPVSTPLKWGEVKKGLDPKDHNAKNILKRLAKIGDIWKPVLGKGIDLEECLKKLEKVIE